MVEFMDEIVVFSYRRCPFAMRVRLALHEKGISFSTREEDLKNLSEELRRLHPEAKVPVLVHGQRVIYESSVITEYIEDAFPETAVLMPQDAGLRADVRLWTYWCNAIFKPDLDRYKYGESRFPADECVGIETSVSKHLEKIEQRLTKQDWLVGESYSLADIHVFPFVRQLSRMKPEPPFMVGFSAVVNWMNHIAKRAAFLKTMEKSG